MTIVKDTASCTPEEYLAREAMAEARSEYSDGNTYAMVGASRAHNLITLNTASELHSLLRGRPCETYMSDMRVKVSQTRLYAYPDVVVVCGAPRFEQDQGENLLNPTVLIEVLSPSTEAYDRGGKFAHYRRLDSLREYILIAQDHVHVEHYERRGQQWLLTEFSALDDSLSLPVLECQIALREIYARVGFPNPAESTAS
ncbi:MAG: Uma2 family endonuclease [Caldilineaceae bacterium]|nr:Uma2 family endonuclease [Caldilineaceae bacterium]